MKVLGKIILFLFICVTLKISAQTSLNSILIDTNSYYNPQTFAIEFGPNMTAVNIGTVGKSHIYGYSLDLVYWTGKYMGTQLSIGSYDYRNYKLGLFDHLTAYEDYRVVPFQKYNLLKRLAIIVDTGATTWIANGAKSLDVGIGVDFALDKNKYIHLGYNEHLLVIGQDKNSGTLDFHLGINF